jgi:hypothetical protein
MMRSFFLSCLYISLVSSCLGQTHEPFWTDNKGVASKNVKIYIDKTLQGYGGLFPHILTWTGGYDNKFFANGSGKLVLGFAKKENGTRLMVTYDGTMINGKKQGKGIYTVYLSLDTSFIENHLPYYRYTGTFHQDEFDGAGKFEASYSIQSKIIFSEGEYKIVPSDGDYKLDHKIWRKDLFFYKCSGQFAKGKFVETTSKFVGYTGKMPWLGSNVLYKGAIVNGRPNGPGLASEIPLTLLTVDELYNSEEGNFTNGRLNGPGKQTGRDYKYEGNFINGIREGKGKLTVYRKPFGLNEVNKMDPIVSYIVECDFKNGQAEGFTSIFFQNSPAYKYTGPIKNGFIEGTGEIEYLDGSKFRGQFNRGSKEGEGTMVFSNGERFSGNYQKDKPVRGTYFYANGSIYEGDFTSTEEIDYMKGKRIINYKRHGVGTITEKNGRIYRVSCNNGTCTETY